MIVSAHQPAYLPWLGYFDKIARSDVFVIFDSVQFEKNSFTNRNRIKTPSGLGWLTVPVRSSGHLSSSILNLEIANEHSWKEKHLKSIVQNYSKAIHFNTCFPKLEALYAPYDRTLIELCDRQLAFWMEVLEITTQIRRLGTLNLARQKSDLVLDTCIALKATKYIAGALGRNYLHLASFGAAEIEIEFQDFKCPPYPQLYGNFVPNLSVLDFWMNVGPKAAALFQNRLNA